LRLRSYLLMALLALGSMHVSADEMLMARVMMKADLAFEYLVTSIEEHGYSVAHVQTCDEGMADFGYKSDFYRAVFFGKGEEVRRISAAHPEFAAYMPLKITVVAEKGETVLSIVNPRVFNSYYPDDRSMQVQFGRWHNDIQSMFEDLQQAAKQAPAT